jgi:hypothetical protein
MSWVPAGWYGLVDRLLTDIESAVGEDARVFKVEQIKEKYSTLRLYFSLHGRTRLTMDLSSPAGRIRSQQSAAGALAQRIDELIAAAETESAHTCQRCGAPARRRDSSGWLATLCDRHAREAQAKDDDD